MFCSLDEALDHCLTSFEHVSDETLPKSTIYEIVSLIEDKTAETSRCYSKIVERVFIFQPQYNCFRGIYPIKTGNDNTTTLTQIGCRPILINRRCCCMVQVLL